MKALNRHYTFKWKKKRKDKHGDRCKSSKCLICHYVKVFHMPNIHLRIENEKLKYDG